MATYKYISTDLLTGQILADQIPLNVESFSAQLNGGGTLSGSLDLQQAATPGILAGAVSPYAVNRPFIAALECQRAVLWVLADNVPVWCGIVWDWPDMTRQQGGPLPVNAQTLDSLWGKRLITDTLEYQAIDLFTVFLDLVTYGLTKQSSYLSTVSPAATRPAAYLALMATHGRVANLVQPVGQLAGVPWTIGYTWSDLTQVSSAWSDMVTAGNFEFAFNPGFDENGNLACVIQLAYTQLGRPVMESGYSITYPGNCLDYGYQRTGSQGANYIWASAPPNGSAEQWGSVYPHGADLPTINEGYPVLEATVSWEGSVVTSQAQINAFADGQIPIWSAAMTTPVINVGGDSLPQLKDIVLGDAFEFAATSPLHPATEPGSQPGFQQKLRVTGWTCYPPGPSQSEYYQLTTSAVT